MERFIKPFPNITWFRPDGEKPKKEDLPTASTTLLFDPVERAAMRNKALLLLVEDRNLTLPPSGIGTEILAKAYISIGAWLTAKNSKERKNTRREIDRIIATEEGALAVNTLITTQVPENPHRTQLTELDRDLERIIKPPSYFKIRGIFQPHRVETDQQAESFEKQFLEEAESFFRPTDNNIVFLEDAHGDLHNNRDFYQALEIYGSARKAYAFAREKHTKQLPGDLTDLRRKNREAVDELVDLQIRMLDIVAQPKVEPEMAYIWRQFLIIDKLIGRKYKIDIIFERGTVTERSPVVTPDTSEEELIQATHDLLRMIRERVKSDADDIIANQVVELEKGVNPGIRTNLLMIFGSHHVQVIDKLPSRLQQVTTTHFRL